MSSGIGVFDSLLTLFLSRGAMIGTAILLLCSVVVFVKSKGRKAVRVTCGVLMAYSMIYLVLIVFLSYLFSSGHP